MVLPEPTVWGDTTSIDKSNLLSQLPSIEGKLVVEPVPTVLAATLIPGADHNALLGLHDQRKLWLYDTNGDTVKIRRCNNRCS